MKSIYSLVLSDEVVEAADRMAYSMHTSRSNLIDQILAEHLSCTTPEMRMQSVFSAMELQMKQFRMLEQTSAYIRTLQSRLDYKYKPTVQYFVELYRTPKDGMDGSLRIQLRTQSGALLTMLEAFFRMWMRLEEQCIPQSAGTVYRISPGKLERSIRIRIPDMDEKKQGMLIGLFIRKFDSYLKDWLAAMSEPQEQQETTQRLEKYLYLEMRNMDAWI